MATTTTTKKPTKREMAAAQKRIRAAQAELSAAYAAAPKWIVVHDADGVGALKCPVCNGTDVIEYEEDVTKTRDYLEVTHEGIVIFSGEDNKMLDGDDHDGRYRCKNCRAVLQDPDDVDLDWGM